MNWEEYALKLAQTASLKSKDPYVKVGACILRHDFSVAGLGYNGFPSGIKEDWSDRNERRKFVIHAEKNALKYTRPGEGYLIASTLLPCNDCLKEIISYGIKKIVYNEIYKFDDSTLEMAEKFGIELIKIDELLI